MDEILKQRKRSIPKITIQYKDLWSVQLQSLLYADDIIFMGEHSKYTE